MRLAQRFGAGYHGPMNTTRLTSLFKGRPAPTSVHASDVWAVACAVVGMAFWWPMLRNSVTGFVFGTCASTAAQSQGALGLFMAVALAAAIAAAAGSSRWPGLGRPARWTAPALVGLCALSSLANAVAVVAPGSVVLGAGSVLLGLAYVGLSLAWGGWLVGWVPSPGRMLAVAIASYAASFAVGYLSYLPVPLSLVRPIGAPVISGLCWYACWRREARCVDARTPRGLEPTVQRSIYILVLVFFLVGSVATGFINTGSVAYAPSSSTLVRDTLSLVLSLGLLGVVVAVGQTQRAEFLLISVLGVVQFGGIFLATFWGEALLPLGTGLMQASKSCFSLVLFVSVLLGGAGRGLPARCRRLLLLFVVPTVASFGISYLLVPALVSSFAIAYEGFWGTLSLTMGFGLGVLVFVFLSSMAMRGFHEPVSLGTAGAPDASSTAERARALGEAYGCTTREQDVLALLVAGNTYKKVAELLGVSENTVQYHSKNIYRKLGVHTKQELVDLVARG